MSGFDTNPFADPVDINPFQVGSTPLTQPCPAGPPPPQCPARRDVALSEAPPANGGAAPPRLDQSERGGGTGGT